jgi:catechol 2,3-dioxygenase-like lactoylglutathione lyase family enzyme
MTDCAYEVLGVGHTGITVSDIQRSLRFYRTVLGFPGTTPIRIRGAAVECITGVPGAELDVAFVRAPGHAIELLSFVAPEDRARSSLRPCDAGFFHLCFKVRDIDAVVGAARAGGFEAVRPIYTLTEGPVAGMKVVYLRDPDGVCLELSEAPPGLAFEELMLARATL